MRKVSPVQREWDRLCSEDLLLGHVVDFEARGNSAAGNNALTKQQKRDLKRNEKVKNTKQISILKPIVNTSTSVYKREIMYPVVFPVKKVLTRFIESGDNVFEALLKTSYDGFILQDPTKFPESFHESFRAAFEQLDKQQFFQYDITQPAGLSTRLAKTMVTRCLLGDAGITYKYLGIRMFSFPWNAGEAGASTACVHIGKLNELLVGRTQLLLNNLKKKDVGSCRYNMTLINRCSPDDVKLKEEPLFKKDKSVVSWHADSTLEHFSSIAVYNCTNKSGNAVPQKIKNKSSDKLWRIALRVHHDAEGPGAAKKKVADDDAGAASSLTAPPIAVSLPSKWSYFLLDDFNHHHQHAVLAGDSLRWSSTHRVCRVDGHTFWSIKSRCTSALQGSMTMDPKQLRSEQLALSEVEFEWIRMLYVQGQLHYDLHEWWHDPIQVLLDLWKGLEQRCAIAIQALKDSVHGAIEAEGKALAKRKRRADAVTLESFDVVLNALDDREIKREGWRAREGDASFRKLPKNCRPIQVPFPTIEIGESGDPVAENGLPALIEELKICRELFLKKTKETKMAIKEPVEPVVSHEKKQTVSNNSLAPSKPSGVFTSFFANGRSSEYTTVLGKRKDSEEFEESNRNHGKKSKIL